MSIGRSLIRGAKTTRRAGAVSLDRDRTALTDYIESKELRWKSTYDLDMPKGNGLAADHGVMALPLPILVDREDPVVSINARGTDLARLLDAEKK